MDSSNAFDALVAAASSVDLDASGAELIWIGSSAVFRFASEPITGRVAPSIDRLESVGIPAVRAIKKELAGAYRELEFDLAPGVIHGDANVGNVIRDREGTAILADLDGFAIGPREWDLVLTALYFERFGWHTESEYALFTETYGYDVMKWSGYSTMRDLRELLMVAWLAQRVRSDDGRRELAKRIETLRTDGSRTDRSPF